MKWIVLIWAVAAIIAGGVVAAELQGDGETQASPGTPSPTATPVAPPIIIDALVCHQSSAAYATAEGEITNNSDRPLADVLAVVTWRDASGQFITAGDALVDFNPLLPGQQSPYSVIVPYNPAMASCEVAFQELLGPFIPSAER